jgi:hypothetical protein
MNFLARNWHWALSWWIIHCQATVRDSLSEEITVSTSSAISTRERREIVNGTIVYTL